MLLWMLDKHSNDSEALYVLKKTFSLGSKHYFWIKKKCWPNRAHKHTHTHTHTHTRAPIPHSHTDASQITQCCTYTTSLHVQAIYITHGKRSKPDPMTQLRRFFMKFVRSYSSSYCFSSHKSGSVSNTVFIVRAPDATGWFLEDFWLSFFLSSSENKSKSWKQTPDIKTETGRRDSWYSM